MISTAGHWLAAQMVLEFVVGGKTVRLCDFASAGLSGRDYISWLPLAFSSFAEVPCAPFTKHAPGRTFVLGEALAAQKLATETIAVKLHVFQGSTVVGTRRFSVTRSRYHLLKHDIASMLKQRLDKMKIGGIVDENEFLGLGSGAVLRLRVDLQ